MPTTYGDNIKSFFCIFSLSSYSSTEIFISLTNKLSIFFYRYELERLENKVSCSKKVWEYCISSKLFTFDGNNPEKGWLLSSMREEFIWIKDIFQFWSEEIRLFRQRLFFNSWGQRYFFRKIFLNIFIEISRFFYHWDWRTRNLNFLTSSRKIHQKIFFEFFKTFFSWIFIKEKIN